MSPEVEKITKKEADRLMAIPGKVRGSVILTSLEYAGRQKDKNIISQLERRLAELGHFFDLKSIKPMEKYPDALSVLIILLIKEILHLNEEDIFKMGQASLQLPYFVKLISKYFVSMETMLNQAGKHWEKYFDFGKVEVVQYDKQNNYVIIRVIGYNFHPLICFYHRGYFVQAARMSTGKQKVESREDKCVHREDPYHEYHVFWQ